MSAHKNTEQFNEDALKRGGYAYTTNAPLSSILANKRMSDAILGLIDEDVKTVLDIGCGDGTYTAEIADRRPRIEVSAFDPAKEAIKIANQKYPRILFYEGDILNSLSLSLLQRGHQFDLVIMRGVLHHVSNPDLAIHNAGVMANKIIILEPNGNSPILKIIEKVSPYHRQHQERSFSAKQLSYWCLKNNFKIKKLEYINFVPVFFPAPLAKIIYFFQPLLEKIYFLKKYAGAQIVIYAEKYN